MKNIEIKVITLLNFLLLTHCGGLFEKESETEAVLITETLKEATSLECLKKDLENSDKLKNQNILVKFACKIDHNGIQVKISNTKSDLQSLKESLLTLYGLEIKYQDSSSSSKNSIDHIQSHSIVESGDDTDFSFFIFFTDKNISLKVENIQGIYTLIFTLSASTSEQTVGPTSEQTSTDPAPPVVEPSPCQTYKDQGYLCYEKTGISENEKELYLVPAQQNDNHLVIMSDATYTLWTKDVSDGSEDSGYYTDKQRISKNIYELFKDDFDFIILFTQYDYVNQINLAQRADYSGSCSKVKNDVQGIGLNLFDGTTNYGSEEKLQSFIHMPNHYLIKNGPLLHEILHNWGNFFFYHDGSSETVPTSGHHGVKGIGGQLGGFNPTTLKSSANNASLPNSYQLQTNQYRAASHPAKNSFGTIANGGMVIAYSPFDLWLMGLKAPENVPDFKIPVGLSNVNAMQGYFEATSIQTVALSDILANPSNYAVNQVATEVAISNTNLVGPRVPNSNNSQKSFKALMVLLTKPSLFTQTRTETVKVTECVKQANQNTCTDGYYYPSGTWFLGNTQYCNESKCREQEETATVEYKRIDDFKNDLSWFAQDAADTQTVCSQKTWQAVPSGYQTCGNSSISVKMIYTFKEATGGAATISLGPLRNSLK